MATPKLFVLGRPEDFTNQEVEWLTDLITEKLTDDGIKNTFANGVLFEDGTMVITISRFKSVSNKPKNCSESC